MTSWRCPLGGKDLRRIGKHRTTVTINVEAIIDRVDTATEAAMQFSGKHDGHVAHDKLSQRVALPSFPQHRIRNYKPTQGGPLSRRCRRLGKPLVPPLEVMDNSHDVDNHVLIVDNASM